MRRKINVLISPLNFLILVIFIHVFGMHSQYVKHLEYEIQEELPVSSIVGNILQDTNMNLLTLEDQQKLRFQIRHTGKWYHYFTIDEKKGILYTSQILDREFLCLGKINCDLPLDISVKPNYSVFKVLVHLMDVNDHFPKFVPNKHILNIPESASEGSVYIIPSAEDEDLDRNTIQYYKLENSVKYSNLFELVETHHQDGLKDVKLKLKQKLDRELEDKHILKIVALDGGEPSRSGSIEIHINVLDANDNNPIFSEDESYFVDVPENIPIQSTLITVHAKDADAGLNGQVIYSLSEPSEKNYGHIFGIDSTSGDIFLKSSLDYEAAQQYTLSIKARDQGEGSLPQFARVKINVSDVNDNRPIITVNIMSDTDIASISENEQPGTLVAHVSVKDLDSDNNKLTECWIDDTTNFIFEKMFETQYTIKSVISFDREVRSHYEILLTCKDKGLPPLSSLKQIEVRILDVNDNAPKLSTSNNNFNLIINENNLPNSIIAKINATDADSGRNGALHFSLQALDKKSNGVLSIDPDSGKLTAKISFDYEKERAYKYLLTVSDRGNVSLSTSTTISLDVNDLNDESPKFEKKLYSFSISEKNPIGSSVGILKAVDADISPIFKKIKYLIDSVPDDAFDINETTGEISVLKRLDREESDTYRFSVIAINPYQPPIQNKVNVTIYIEDENDNAPIFIFPNAETGNTITISSDKNKGSLVTRLRASDFDVGLNGELIFAISNGNVDNLFEIEPLTGVITVAGNLKEFSKLQQNQDNLYNLRDWIQKLVVSVSDSGVPPLMSIADLNIKVNFTNPKKELDSSLALTGKLSNKNIFILASLIAMIFFLVVCIISAIVCMKTRKKKRERERGKYIVTKVVDAFETGSNVCSQISENGHPNGKLCKSPYHHPQNSHTIETPSSMIDCNKRMMKVNGSLATMDSASTKSEDVLLCNCNNNEINQQIENGNDSNQCLNDEDQEMCRLHNPGQLISSSWDPSLNARNTPSPLAPSSDSARCSNNSSNFKDGFRHGNRTQCSAPRHSNDCYHTGSQNQSRQQSPHYCPCCNVNQMSASCHYGKNENIGGNNPSSLRPSPCRVQHYGGAICGMNSPQQQNMYSSSTARKRSLYSPENISLQVTNQHNLSSHGHHHQHHHHQHANRHGPRPSNGLQRSRGDPEIESLCSGSTWTDSGRGPSEEDEHLRNARLDNFIKNNIATANAIPEHFQKLDPKQSPPRQDFTMLASTQASALKNIRENNDNFPSPPPECISRSNLTISVSSKVTENYSTFMKNNLNNTYYKHDLSDINESDLSKTRINYSNNGNMNSPSRIIGSNKTKALKSSKEAQV